jgi:hypothetical protein
MKSEQRNSLPARTDIGLSLLNTIEVSELGDTIFGQDAIRLWDYGRGKYPRAQCGNNRYFVYEGSILRAAQPTKYIAMRYMKPGCVLVSV